MRAEFDQRLLLRCSPNVSGKEYIDVKAVETRDHYKYNFFFL